MGCSWGVERLFWQLPACTAPLRLHRRDMPNPTYREVVPRTGHAEAVRVVYDPVSST
ncbi:peptide-methionine (S)-S-oxide reductase [Shigella flexneri]